MTLNEDSASERSPLIPSIATSNTLADDDNVSLLRSDESKEELSRTRGACICLAVWVLIFILTCNVSLMSTIQSPIAIELEAYSAVSWFTSAYLISVTSITPVAGRLSKIFTSRVYLPASIVIQSCGLLVTSQAKSVPSFLAGRAITGMGAAAITPVAFILVTELTSKERRGFFFGCINTGYTTGVACGAIIAGALEPVIGWRNVFRLQLPIVLSAALLAFYSIPMPEEDLKASLQNSTLGRKLSRIDYLGVITLISFVVLLLYGLSATTIKLTPICLSVGCLILFILVEARWAQEPIVPLTVLRSRANVLTGIATMGVMTGRWAILFYSPVYVIAVRGWSQASAGLTLIPTNVGFALGGILVGWLHIRRAGSFYLACLVAFLLFSASQLLVAYLSTKGSNVYGYLGALFANGFVTGALLNYSLAHILHRTLPATHVIVIPLNAMFRSLSGSFGSSISGGIFIRSLQHSLKSGFKHEDIPHKAELIRKLIGTPTLVHQLTGKEYEVAVASYSAALKALLTAGSVLALVMLFVQAGTGWDAPKALDEDETLSSGDLISPVISREPIAN